MKKKLSLIMATLIVSIKSYAEEKLNDITITSTNKTTQSIQNTTSTISVITSDDIEERGYLTLSEVINSVAGISVANSGGLGQPTSFFVRGASSGKVLVLIDGMRLNDPSTTNGQALLENLTTSNISQIEIIKGGESSIWGSNATAGVINIITKEAKDGVHGTVGIKYGSHQTKGGDIALSFKDKKLTAQILGSYLKTDGISAVAPRDSEEDGYENRNLNLKLGYAFDSNNEIKISYNQSDSDIEYDTTLSTDRNSTTTNKQKNILLNYIFKSDNYTTVLSASKGDYDREATTDNGISNFNSQIIEYSIVHSLRYDKNRVILGVEHKDIDGFNKYSSPFFNSLADSSYKNSAIFISNLYNINANTLLETNLRYDDFDKFENKTTYKIGVKHNHIFLDGFTSSANYYSSYDAPSIYQLGNTLSPLKPSYTKGYNISMAYKNLLSVTYFKNKVEESIDYLYNPLTFTGGYYNINQNLKFSGVELSSQIAITDELLISANYTHLIEYKDGSDNGIRRAKDTLNASIDYYSSTDTHFGINAQYIGDREDLGDTSTGNYTLWNLNFDTKLSEDTKLTINAKNIFDKDYQSVYGYATEGRSFYANIKYSF